MPRTKKSFIWDSRTVVLKEPYINMKPLFVILQNLNLIQNKE